MKFSKCRFAQQSISYLGHIVSSHGVSTDPSKIDAVQQWPTPQNIKELRSFLGLAGYYRKFVRNYAILARPLTDLLKKGSLFVWTPVHRGAFEALKSALVSAPVLALPDFSFKLTPVMPVRVPFYCKTVIRLPLSAKRWAPRTRALSTYEKEFLATLVAVEQWRSYLQHNEFTMFTDQRSLMHISRTSVARHRGSLRCIPN